MRTIGPNDPPRRPGPGEQPDGPDRAHPDATRRVDPVSRESGPPPADATQRIDAVPPADPTRRTDRPALEGEAQPIDPYAEDPAGADAVDGPVVAEEEDDGPRRGRSALLVGIGLVIGFIAAFVVVALGSSDDAPAEDPQQVAALEEEVAGLEAELEERDAVIADQQAQLDAADSAAGEEAQELQAQRDALDERASQLDARASQLDDRETGLDQREAELDERDAQPPPEAPETDAPEAETPDAPEAETPDDPAGTDDDGDSLSEQAETIVDRVLEGIRDLFAGDG